jgi:1-acyl-sn-glycerol-3-phosphate acyltransferase
MWVLATAAVDVLAGQARTWPRTRAWGFFALYLSCEVVGVLAATLIHLVTLGARFGGPDRYLRANAALQRWWTSSLFKGGLRLFSMRVEAEGMEHAKDGPFVLFVRHASAADSVLAAALVANPHHHLLRYVLKQELLWDPCLDIVGKRLPNAFIDRDRPGGGGAIDAVRRLATKLHGRTGALVFPEGTRFAAAKLAPALAALRNRKQEGLADLASGFRHVLPPHLGGALAMLDAAPGVDLLLLEHTGLERATTFAEFWGGGLVGRSLVVRLRRFAASTIPAEGRDLWLFERWAEMDDWISEAAKQTSPNPFRAACHTGRATCSPASAER